MYDDLSKPSPSRRTLFPCYFSRSDLVALLVALFVVILALADLGRRHLGGLFRRMTPAVKSTPRQENRLMLALEAALAGPVTPGLDTADLFDSAAPFLLRGKTVFVEGAPRGVRVVISADDLFETASAVLHDEGRRLVEEFAALVRQYPNRLEIVAFVDQEEVPSDASRLSWKRVQTVMDYLESRHINRSRLLPGAAGTVPAGVQSDYPPGRIEIIVEVPLR